MTVKNPRFQKWLDKLSRLVDESTQKRRLFRDKIEPRKVKERKKWYRFSTQKIRREIVRGLGELYDIALDFAKDDSLEPKEREKWSRLAAYTAQTINTIIDSFDEVEIEKTLDELKKYARIRAEEG